MISVIIPVYNAAQTIENCLASLLGQTRTELEIIAVNDGSTDNSGAILEKYQDKIRILNQENYGAPTARNRGFEASRGEYVIFCDADIIMKPNMLALMEQKLTENPAAAYVYSSFKFGFKTFKLWPFDPAKLKKMPYIHTSSLIRREFFPGFDENLKKFQDWDLWLTILERGGQGIWLDQSLFSIKSGGTMSAWLPKIFYQLPWLKKVKAYRQAERIIKIKHNLL